MKQLSDLLTLIGTGAVLLVANLLLTPPCTSKPAKTETWLRHCHRRSVIDQSSEGRGFLYPFGHSNYSHLVALETCRKIPRYPAPPALRLERLAGETSQQGQHIGSLLVLDALRRLCRKGPWAIFLVDAKNERAAIFYERFLFQRIQETNLSLLIKIMNADRFVNLL